MTSPMTEVTGTSPEFVLNIITRFTEFRGSLITSRLVGGRKTKARGGQHAGGRSPLGYRAMDRALVLDPIEARGVRRAYELR